MAFWVYLRFSIVEQYDGRIEFKLLKNEYADYTVLGSNPDNSSAFLTLNADAPAGRPNLPTADSSLTGWLAGAIAAGAAVLVYLRRRNKAIAEY